MMGPSAPNQPPSGPCLCVPTRSYRTRHPLRVIGELTDWVGHSPQQLEAMREGLLDPRWKVEVEAEAVLE